MNLSHAITPVFQCNLATNSITTNEGITATSLTDVALYWAVSYVLTCNLDGTDTINLVLWNVSAVGMLYTGFYLSQSRVSFRVIPRQQVDRVNMDYSYLATISADR
jgi:hypothetical protein